MRHAVRLTVALIAVIAAAPAAHAQRLWNPDDRVTITAFGDVRALAYDGRRLFAATTNGLEIYDAIGRRWLAPSTVEDGYPFMEQPVSLTYDRSQGGLWLVAASGNAYLWSDLSGRWDLRPPGDLPRDRQRDADDADVAFNILRRTLSLDPSGRRYRITAAIAADRPGTYWVGTDGGNVILADSRSLSTEWLTFGTLSPGVGALATDKHGNVWFGGDGNGLRNGITRSDGSLQTWTTFESYSTRAPRSTVVRMLGGDTIWAASNEGVHALLPGARVWQIIGEREGLPSDNVRALERSLRGIWAGTNRGVAFIDPVTMRSSSRGLEGARINGLANRGDTIWIASDRGLFLAVATDAGADFAPAPGSSEARFRASITSVARVGDKIAALVEGRVYLYGTAWSEPILLQSANRAYALRGEGNYLYLLSRDGVEEWNVAANTSAFLTAPADIPEAPRDVVRAGEHLWVATPAGAIRLRWP